MASTEDTVTNPVPLAIAPTAVQPPSDSSSKVPTAAPSRQRITKVTDWLLDNNKIGAERAHHKGYRRMVVLKIQEIFNKLADLYWSVFVAHWRTFKVAIEASIDIGNATSPIILLAKNYISHWLLDLYYSNRNAVRELSHPAYASHYNYEIAQLSTEYDAFLVALNAMIRPTIVQYTAEESMYIPHFGTDLFTDPANPFKIQNWYLNHTMFHATIQLMKEKKEWIMQPLMTTITGRAAWLFDWHEDQAYAWFPQEGNYSSDDVSLAFILGTACTHNLGPRDRDEWVSYPHGIKPARVDHDAHKRISMRVMFGAIEVRTYAQREVYPTIVQTLDADEDPASKKRKGPDDQATPTATAGKILIIRDSSASGREDEESGETSEPPINTIKATPSATDKTPEKKIWQYRISDYCYHRMVILRTDIHTRSAALKMLNFDSKDSK